MSEPIRVGILNDGEHTGDEGGAGSSVFRQLGVAIQFAVDERTAQGRIDRPIELVHVHGAGLPGGTAHAVERAFRELVDQGVLLVVGPAIGDNAIVATPVADACRTPAINWSASERARSDYMFHLQVGSHEDESILMARYAASIGLKKLGVVYDKTPIGRRHLSFFEAECELVGVSASAKVPIPALPPEALDEVRTLKDAGVDGLVYMGLGWAGREVARAKTALGWDVPTIMNAAGMRGADPAFARDIESWVYPDMHSDGNAVLRRVRQQIPSGGPSGPALAFGYDMGQLVAEAIARSWELNREGFKEGLEQIKVVPAAEGYDGTTLGFGKWDRGALKGRYLVMRQWRDAVSVEL